MHTQGVQSAVCRQNRWCGQVHSESWTEHSGWGLYTQYTYIYMYTLRFYFWRHNETTLFDLAPGYRFLTPPERCVNKL